jgi:hypothetical protein
MSRYGGHRLRANLLTYECEAQETESISWIAMKFKGVCMMTPLLFSSSYGTAPDSLCMAQIYNQKAPTQTNGDIEYACMHTYRDDETGGRHASISAQMIAPDGSNQTLPVQATDSQPVPINCTRVNLPTEYCIHSTGISTNIDIASRLRKILAAISSKGNCNDVKYNMRMNHSLVAPTIQNCTLSVITAGSKLWQDKSSSAYLATVASTAVTNKDNSPNFAVCTSNRIWTQNGGDPNVLVACLDQYCVDLMNRMLPMLQMCMVTDGCKALEEELLELMQLSVGGSILGEKGSLSLCHRGNGSVISPVVFLHKPSKAHLSTRGQLRCTCTMLLVDTETETAIMQNPAMLGEGLLTVFSGNDTIHLHAANKSVDISYTLLPACQPLQKTVNKSGSKELVIAGIGDWHGRLSTRYKVHSMCDFVCAIDQANSKLMTYQTMGNTYQLQRPIDNNATLLIHNSLAKLSRDYCTFQAFVSLVGKSKLAVDIPVSALSTSEILANTIVIDKTISAILPDMLPNSVIGKQIYNSLRSSNDELKDVCAPYVIKIEEGNQSAHLAPIRHADILGPVQRICLIASGACNSPTNNRAVLLVQKQSPSDVVVLFIDRHLGTDPEYFSSDLRMDTRSLAKASSVRTALDIPTGVPFHVHSIVRMSSDTTDLFSNKNGNLVHGKRYPMFTVQWKTDTLSNEWNRTILSVFTSNRVSTDGKTESPLGRVITSKSIDGELHTTFNSNWGLRVVSNTII